MMLKYILKGQTIDLLLAEMVPRKNKLTLLKQKITAMQTELIALQGQKTEIERSLSQKRNSVSPSRSTSKNRNYKSPTFWTTNPITFNQTYSNAKPANLSPSRKVINKETRRTISPGLKEIVNTIDRSYYNQKKEKDKRQREVSPKAHIFKGKRFQFSEFGTTGYFESSKETKIKTYVGKKTDPILDPEQEKYTGVKIVKSRSRSPDNMLTEHPNSNERLYNFPQNTVIVDRKGGLRYRNESKLALCSSLGELVPIKFDENTSPVRKKKSQKKHYPRYFRQNFCSQFDFE